MSQTHRLYRLQTLDSKIDKAKQELAQVEAQLGESDTLNQARSAVEADSQHLRRVQTTLTDLELEVKSLSNKIADHEKLLYSGKGMSAKEASNLQDEVNSLKRWHSNREELLLETMVEAEEAEDRLSQAQEMLADVETNWQTDQADLVQKQAALQAEITELQAQRPTMAGTIDADDLTDYEDLRRKKAGVAVTAIERNVCQSCGMIASNNKIQRARSGPELMYCGGCGRILHVL